MKFEHRASVGAAREAVWALLSDFSRAAMLLPGVGEVTELDDGSYEGAMRVRVGPLGLNLSGNVEVTQNEAEGRWSMNARARDGRVGGGVQAAIEVTLSETAPGESELLVDADIQFMGRLGELGQPLIRRKAETTLKQFAENLKRAVSREATG